MIKVEFFPLYIIFRQVNLNGNDIYNVQPAAFSGLHVESIDLSNNQLVGISPKAFRYIVFW